MVKYKITNLGKRSIIVDGKGLSYGEFAITEKAIEGPKLICEKIEEVQKVKPKLDLDKKNEEVK